MDKNDIRRLEQLLEDLGFLTHMKDTTEKRLNQIFSKEQFIKGEIIIKKDEMGDALFIVSKGSAEVFTGEVDEEIKSVYVARQGDFFGEIALVTEGPRTAWVVAQGDVEVFMIKKDDLHNFLMNVPEIAEIITNTAKKRLLH